MSKTPEGGPGQHGRMRDDRFDAIFARADAIPGWLTRDRARTLYDAARALPVGARIVSHQGRSTVVLASPALGALPSSGFVCAARRDGPGTTTRSTRTDEPPRPTGSKSRLGHAASVLAIGWRVCEVIS